MDLDESHTAYGGYASASASGGYVHAQEEELRYQGTSRVLTIKSGL